MPIYAYRCKKCGSEEEHIQKMSDPPLTKCSACGGRLQRLVSPAAFHLKGGGWYKDGYASAKPGSADSGGGDGGGSESKGDAKKSESKGKDTGKGNGKGKGKGKDKAASS